MSKILKALEGLLFSKILAEIDKFFIKFVTEPFQKINY
jgi:hypothetical protein